MNEYGMSTQSTLGSTLSTPRWEYVARAQQLDARVHERRGDRPDAEGERPAENPVSTPSTL